MGRPEPPPKQAMASSCTTLQESRDSTVPWGSTVWLVENGPMGPHSPGTCFGFRDNAEFSSHPRENFKIQKSKRSPKLYPDQRTNKRNVPTFFVILSPVSVPLLGDTVKSGTSTEVPVFLRRVLLNYRWFTLVSRCGVQFGPLAIALPAPYSSTPLSFTCDSHLQSICCGSPSRWF